jgi:hypothetical protein
LGNWVKSNVDYGRRLVDSGIEGARSGQDEFLDGEPLAPFLGESVKGSLVPAAIGACVGALVGLSHLPQEILGCHGHAGLWFAWLRDRADHRHGLESRHLSASVASGALKNIGKVRDERWLTKNPVNYA